MKSIGRSLKFLKIAHKYFNISETEPESEMIQCFCDIVIKLIASTMENMTCFLNHMHAFHIERPSYLGHIISYDDHDYGSPAMFMRELLVIRCFTHP